MNSEIPNILTAYNVAVVWFEQFEELLRNSNLSKPEILQYLTNAQTYIQSIIQYEVAENPYSVALFQLQATIQSIALKIENHLNDTASAPPTDNKTRKFYAAIAQTKVTPKIKGLDEIAGYSDVKKQLKTLFVLPRKQPQLYIGHQISKTVLLYGPPGTGKTSLAHALASESHADIYCVTASTIMSAYIGETEKMIEVLFRSMKNVTKTSILFIDEIDGLCRKRHGTEHDHNRRLKTEIMCQLSNFDENKNAFLICATNCPWDLDSAFIRRFQKRIYVPLPNRNERVELLKFYTKGTPLRNTDSFWDTLLDLTEGYSGSDLQQLVRSALMKPIAELEDVKIWKLVNEHYVPFDRSAFQDFSEHLRFCSLEELPDNSVQTREVMLNDLLDATRQVASSIPTSEITRFNEYVTHNK